MSSLVLPRSLCLAAFSFFGAVLAAADTPPAQPAQPVAPAQPAIPSTSATLLPPDNNNTISNPSWSFGDLADRLPELLAERLPAFNGMGSVRVYVRPHLGDIFHKGYSRIPVGVRVKVTDNIELNAELQSFFSRGVDNGGSGLSGMNLGAKYDHLLPSILDGGLSAGINYRTPFNHSPKEFTDGYRHTQPYIAAAHEIVPAWKLLGYGSFSANMFEHTALPSNFGRNQLHANSLAVLGGVARDWGRFHVSLTARVASTELMSDEGRQNFSLRPEVIIPLRRKLSARTQIYLTVGAHGVWGPNGFESGTNTSLRVDFKLDRDRNSVKKPSTSDPKV